MKPYSYTAGRWRMRPYIHPDYSITYENKVSLKSDAINIGSLIRNIPSMKNTLQVHYRRYLFSFDPELAEQLTDIRGCNHRIEVTTSKDKPHMGRIYESSQEEEKFLIQHLFIMIKERKI